MKMPYQGSQPALRRTRTSPHQDLLRLLLQGLSEVHIQERKGGACVHSVSSDSEWGHQHLCQGFASPFLAERRSYTSVEELLSLSSLNHFSHFFLEAVGVTVVLETIFTFLS